MLHAIGRFVEETTFVRPASNPLFQNPVDDLPDKFSKKKSKAKSIPKPVITKADSPIITKRKAETTITKQPKKRGKRLPAFLARYRHLVPLTEEENKDSSASDDSSDLETEQQTDLQKNSGTNDR